MKNQKIFPINLQKLRFILVVLMVINYFLAKANNILSQTPGYQIGAVVADFSLKNIDGSMLSLSANTNVQGYILVFTGNHCPYAKAYETRINELNKKYKPMGYPVIAINPNFIGENGEDGLDEMKIMASDKGFTFPFLKDENQELTNAFGAKRTPTAFVLKKENGKFILKYAGAIDDNSQSADAVTKKYVEQAINELLIGKNVSITTTKAIGCGIKWRNG